LVTSSDLAKGRLDPAGEFVTFCQLSEPGKFKPNEYAMAKRKKPTFERLRNGDLNRRQRRELQRRLNSPDPGLEVVHADAAGIDVGNASHSVSAFHGGRRSVAFVELIFRK